MTDRDIDMHGYHPDEIDLNDLLRQAWECGYEKVTLIHGHGHNRGISVGFVNTNTGYFGLRVRSEIRNNGALKSWIKKSTMDCGHDGSTTVRMKKNIHPTRTEIDLPQRREWAR